MKKFLIHILFTGALFAYSSIGSSFIINKSDVDNQFTFTRYSVIKVPQTSKALFNFCFIEDVDNDNENDDDNFRYSTENNNKPSVVSSSISGFSLQTLDRDKTTNLKSYFLENYSKVNKPNFISFGVLLI